MMDANESYVSHVSKCDLKTFFGRWILFNNYIIFYLIFKKDPTTLVLFKEKEKNNMDHFKK